LITKGLNKYSKGFISGSPAQYEVSIGIDPASPARRDYGRRSALFNDDRAIEYLFAREKLSFVNRGFQGTPLEKHFSLLPLSFSSRVAF
jgi:hypothetical protein